MKKLLVLLLALPFASCKLTYYHPSSQANRVEQVLGVTTAGDTIQVPIDYFGDRINRDYDFNLEYFYWRNNWWLYNNPTFYNRSWFFYCSLCFSLSKFYLSCQKYKMRLHQIGMIYH